MQDNQHQQHGAHRGSLIRDALPERLNETAYALACDVVIAAGSNAAWLKGRELPEEADEESTERVESLFKEPEPIDYNPADGSAGAKAAATAIRPSNTPSTPALTRCQGSRRAGVRGTAAVCAVSTMSRRSPRPRSSPPFCWPG